MSALKVFATVGTDHHPFDRLVEWCDEWAAAHRGDAVTIQYGTSAPPRIASGRDYLTPAELAAQIAEADAVVCHGGPATIAEIRAAGTVPIVVPRRSGRGEHVDDHQVRFAARVAEEGMVRIAGSGTELSSLLERARDDSAAFCVVGDDDRTARSVLLFGDLVDALLS